MKSFNTCSYFLFEKSHISSPSIKIMPMRAKVQYEKFQCRASIFQVRKKKNRCQMTTTSTVLRRLKYGARRHRVQKNNVKASMIQAEAKTPSSLT